MNLIYYYFYSMAAIADTNETASQFKAKGYFSLFITVFLATILKYTGVIFFIPSQSDRKTAYIFGFLTILLLSYLYFSHRGKVVVKYYEEVRGLSKRRVDAGIGILLFICPFVLLLIYDWVKLILPLPLFHK